MITFLDKTVKRFCDWKNLNHLISVFKMWNNIQIKHESERKKNTYKIISKNIKQLSLSYFFCSLDMFFHQILKFKFPVRWSLDLNRFKTEVATWDLVYFTTQAPDTSDTSATTTTRVQHEWKILILIMTRVKT